MTLGQRRTPLKPGKPLARTKPLDRGTAALDRGKPLDRGRGPKARSTKKTAAAPAEADYRATVRRRAGGMCQWPGGCGRPGDDVHHRAQRSTHPHRQTCPETAALLCRAHHDYLDTVEGRRVALDNAMILPAWIDPPCTCPDGRGVSKLLPPPADTNRLR